MMDPYPQMQDAKRRRRLSKATAEKSAMAVRGLKTQNTPKYAKIWLLAQPKTQKQNQVGPRGQHFSAKQEQTRVT